MGSRASYPSRNLSEEEAVPEIVEGVSERSHGDMWGRGGSNPFEMQITGPGSFQDSCYHHTSRGETFFAGGFRKYDEAGATNY